jgi:serine/threonine protein kinase
MNAQPEKANRIGELVGAKYRIVRMLAEGGMGVVYEAQHTVVRRRFAVKFLRPDLARRRDILTRFQHEAEAAGALESENVAAAVDFGIASDGTPYIVMEYLVGENLASLLEREGRLPVARAADLVAQASRGIEVAHASGIIHRDLKPQNLFVCRRQDGTDLLKVLDFGVAKLQALDEMNAATRTGTILGTVAYMSPEQARGDKIVDQRTDVYALGAILYELVSQKRPHPGESNNAVLHHIASQPAVPLESVQLELPDGLVEIVARALSADPAARPQSAGAFAEALPAFARREVWPAVKIEDSGPTRAELTSTALSPCASDHQRSGTGGGAAAGTPARTPSPRGGHRGGPRRPRRDGRRRQTGIEGRPPARVRSRALPADADAEHAFLRPAAQCRRGSADRSSGQDKVIPRRCAPHQPGGHPAGGLDSRRRSRRRPGRRAADGDPGDARRAGSGARRQ